MPVAAVRRAFDARGWSHKRPTPEQAYVIAGYLGVGYSTLLTHLGATMLAGHGVTHSLMRVTPKSIRESLVSTAAGQVVVVDDAWVGRAIDLDVGDHVFLPGSAEIDGASLSVCEIAGGHVLARAILPGITRAIAPAGWSAFIRVSPANYAGRSIFRHEEADNADE